MISGQKEKSVADKIAQLEEYMKKKEEVIYLFKMRAMFSQLALWMSTVTSICVPSFRNTGRCRLQHFVVYYYLISTMKNSTRCCILLSLIYEVCRDPTYDVIIVLEAQRKTFFQAFGHENLRCCDINELSWMTISRQEKHNFRILFTFHCFSTSKFGHLIML